MLKLHVVQEKLRDPSVQPADHEWKDVAKEGRWYRASDARGVMIRLRNAAWELPEERRPYYRLVQRVDTVIESEGPDEP